MPHDTVIESAGRVAPGETGRVSRPADGPEASVPGLDTAASLPTRPAGGASGGVRAEERGDSALGAFDRRVGACELGFETRAARARQPAEPAISPSVNATALRHPST